MKVMVFALVLCGAAVAGGSGAVVETAPRGLDRDSRVIAAMNAAWQQAWGSSTENIEAGFRIDSGIDGYSVVPQPQTNQKMRETMSVVRGVTTAIFHVHPQTGDPRPSSGDRKIAEEYGVQVYVMHISGLYVYDPVSKQTTKLRNNVSWLKP